MLDALNQAHIWNYVLKYAKQNNITLIAITHNKYLAEKSQIESSNCLI